MPETSIIPVATVGAVEQSNLPAKHKTQIREWYDRVMVKGKAIETSHDVAIREVGHVIKADVIAGLTGYVMAKAEEHFGSLDLGTKKNVPLDGIAAAAGAAAAVAFAGQGLASEVGAGVSAASTAILMYRKHRPETVPSATVHGEDDKFSEVDPLLKLAEELDK